VRVLAIVHQPDAGPGVFGEAIRAAGATVEEWAIATAADSPADPLDYDAVLVLGGAVHADQEDRHPWLAAERSLLRELLAQEKPLLGLCLGAQMLAGAAGATPRRAARPEIGWHRVDITAAGREDPLLAPLAPGFDAFQWHSYECPLPPGAVALATSEVCLQAFRVGPAAWGLQFHPEVSAADARHWIEDYRSDPDAIALGVDPAVLGPETETKIPTFNQVGRDICRRWLSACRSRIS
jgi:GMP synthase-like glutamine amidotransferase